MRMKKLLGIILLALSISLPAQADRLITCGFEEDNFNQTMWNQTAVGTVTIETTPVYSGTYSAKLVGTGSATRVGHLFHSFFTSGTFHMRFRARFPSFPSTGHPIFVGAHAGDGGAGFQAEINSDGTLDLVNVADSSVISTSALSTDTWYRFEIRVLISETVGELELWLDGSSQGTLTGKDTVFTNFGKMWLGSRFSSWTGTVFFDDIAFNDTNGTFQNSLAGDGKIFLLEPSSDVSVTWARVPTDTTNWDRVDDLPGTPDDSTTYVDAASATTDQYGMTDLGAEVPSDADIILLDVYGRCGSDGTTGTRSLAFALWDEASSKTAGPTVICKINGWRIIDTDEHQVFDAGTRTRANIADFNVGGDKVGGGSNSRRMTAQWVNVEWIEAAAAPAFRPKVVVY